MKVAESAATLCVALCLVASVACAGPELAPAADRPPTLTTCWDQVGSRREGAERCQELFDALEKDVVARLPAAGCERHFAPIAGPASLRPPIARVCARVRARRDALLASVGPGSSRADFATALVALADADSIEPLDPAERSRVVDAGVARLSDLHAELGYGGVNLLRRLAGPDAARLEAPIAQLERERQILEEKRAERSAAAEREELPAAVAAFRARADDEGFLRDALALWSRPSLGAEPALAASVQAHVAATIRARAARLAVAPPRSRAVSLAELHRELSPLAPAGSPCAAVLAELEQQIRTAAAELEPGLRARLDAGDVEGVSRELSELVPKLPAHAAGGLPALRQLAGERRHETGDLRHDGTLGALVADVLEARRKRPVTPLPVSARAVARRELGRPVPVRVEARTSCPGFSGGWTRPVPLVSLAVTISVESCVSETRTATKNLGSYDCVDRGAIDPTTGKVGITRVCGYSGGTVTRKVVESSVDGEVRVSAGAATYTTPLRLRYSGDAPDDGSAAAPSFAGAFLDGVAEASRSLPLEQLVRAEAERLAAEGDALRDARPALAEERYLAAGAAAGTLRRDRLAWLAGRFETTPDRLGALLGELSELSREW